MSKRNKSETSEDETRVVCSRIDATMSPLARRKERRHGPAEGLFVLRCSGARKRIKKKKEGASAPGALALFYSLCACLPACQCLALFVLFVLFVLFIHIHPTSISSIPLPPSVPSSLSIPAPAPALSAPALLSAVSSSFFLSFLLSLSPYLSPRCLRPLSLVPFNNKQAFSLLLIPHHLSLFPLPFLLPLTTFFSSHLRHERQQCPASKVVRRR